MGLYALTKSCGTTLTEASDQLISTSTGLLIKSTHGTHPFHTIDAQLFYLGVEFQPTFTTSTLYYFCHHIRFFKKWTAAIPVGI